MSRDRCVGPGRLHAVFLLTVLGLAACGGDAADMAPRVLDAADVRVLGGSDSVAVVRDLAVLPDGRVWVQNSVEPLFVGFDAAGRVTATRGRRGGGPEEFRLPSGFVVGGETAWTFDSPRHALIRVDADSLVVVPLPRDAIPRGSVTPGDVLSFGALRTAWLGDEVVLPRRRTRDDLPATRYWTTIWDAELVALDPATAAVRTLVSLPDALGDLDAHFDALSPGFPPFPLWVRLWTVCGDEVRLHDFRRNRVRVFSADGTERDPIPLPPPPLGEVTPRQFVRVAFDLIAAEQAGAVREGMGAMSPADSARLIEAAASRIDAGPDRLGGVLPGYVDLRCDDAGAVWLRPLDVERGGLHGGPMWIRVTADGRARTVRFPDRFDPYRFTGDRAWGVLRNELDVAAIAWISLDG